MNVSLYGRVLLMFITLILLQILIFNNINIGVLGITPLFYVLFILMLPFETPGWLLLLLSFLMGTTIDVFRDTPGLNSAATVFMGFARPWILNMIAPRDGYENGMRPYLMDMGMSWFLYYSVSLVFIHHFVYFVLDEFGLSHFMRNFGQIVLTTLSTEFFVVISQYIAFRKNS